MRSVLSRKGSIAHFEGRRVLRPALTPIVEASRRDVRVTEPLLHLRNVSFVLEGIGRCSSPQRVSANLHAQPFCVTTDDLVNAIGGERPLEASGAVVPNRPQEG